MNINYLDCLDNLIGYRGDCAPIVPSSGIYLNDFTGVIIDELNAGIEADTQDAFTLLDRKIGLAKIAVANDLYTSLALNQRVNTLLSDQVAGYFQDDMQGVAAEANKYKGIQ